MHSVRLASRENRLVFSFLVRYFEETLNNSFLSLAWRTLRADEDDE